MKNKNKQTLSDAPVTRRAESLREFAESIGVSYDTCFRKAKSGELHTIMFGRRRLVTSQEAARVIREGL